MCVHQIDKKQSSKLDHLIKKNVPIIIIKNFLQKNFCKEIIKYCVNISKKNQHRKLTKEGDFFSTDIHPSNVKTDRVFRKYMLGKSFEKKLKKINDIIEFQHNKILKPKNSNSKTEIQVVQYPRGGGYFAEHKHNRYPTNYGMIVALSEKGSDFNKGATNIKVKNKYIDLEKYNINRGDLTLFRFDLTHKITPVDSDKYLSFDNKGRWTLLLSIAPKNLSLSSY
ncbi:hypothetical protein N9500_00895 [Candidatus Pelagibacter sp.]|jgi:hypothetical protein|nr:hypothetical protein [Candidatus Pelagibacter sp.]